MNLPIRLLVAVGAFALSMSAQAQSGTWTNRDNSIWSVSTNWLGATVANGSGSTADFSTTDQTSTRTVILDSSRTIGSLAFADTDTNTVAGWVLSTNTSGGQVLTLAGGTPGIAVSALGAGTNAEINVPLAGTSGFNKTGDGELRLTGVSTLTGQVSVNGGRLYLANGIGSFSGNTLPPGVTNVLNNGSTLSVNSVISNNLAVFIPAGQTGTIEQRTGSGIANIGGGPNSTLNINLQQSGGTLTSYLTWAKNGSISNINVTSTGASIGFWRLRPNATAANGGPMDTANSLSNSVVNLDRINMYAVDNSGGNTYNIGAINGTTNAIWRGAQNGAANYIVGNLNQNMFFEGAMADETVGLSGFNLTKVGTGVLTLSGTNITFGGDAEATLARRGGFIAINQGAIALTNGASFGRGTVASGTEYFVDINVNTNGTYDVSGTTNNTTSPLTLLHGYGRIVGNYVHDEGVLSPGADLAAGTFTFMNNLTITNSPSIDPTTAFTTNSTLRFDISPSLTSGNDRINVAGQAFVDGNPDVVVNFLGGASAGAYTLIYATNGVVGNPSTWNVKWGGRGAAPTVTATANEVKLNVSLGGAANLVWQGYSNAVWDVNTSSNWLNGAVQDKFYQLDSVTFNESSPLQNAVTLNTIVTPSSITVSNDATTYSITGSGQIGGGGTLVKRGAGLFTLTTANSFSGGTTIGGGTLDIGGVASAVGSGSVTMSNGTFQSSLGSGTLTIASPIAFATDTTNYLQADGGSITLFSGNFTGPSSARVVVQSAQSPKALDFDGDKTGFLGTMQFGSQVVLRFRSANAAGTSAIRWEMGEANATLGSLGGGTPRTYPLGYLSGGSSSTLGGHESSGGGLGSDVIWEIGAQGLDSTFAGLIRNGNQSGGSNTTSIVKVGAGTLTLSGGANTYTGSTIVSNGVLAVTTATTIPLASAVAIAAPGKLQLDFTGTNFVRALTIAGVTQVGGSYGATGSGAAHIDNTHFAGTGVLWVGAPPAAALGASVSGTQLTLDWPAGQGWRLQVQTNGISTGISTNWVDVSGATPPYGIGLDALNPTVFYRLTYP